jgi:hypothetical protein
MASSGMKAVEKNSFFLLPLGDGFTRKKPDDILRLGSQVGNHWIGG